MIPMLGWTLILRLSQLVSTIHLFKTWTFTLLCLVTSKVISSLLMLTTLDSVYHRTSSIPQVTIPLWEWRCLVSNSTKTPSHSPSLTSVMLIMCISTLMTLLSLWWTNLFKWISNFPLKEYMVSEKESMSSVLVKVHGLCGLRDKTVLMMTELEANKSMVYILSS